MASKSEVACASPDFSQPWKLSDLVLVVEEERFHVHRTMLAFWSPVFEKMFTSEFQEKDANEVPLPDKKASEIKEMLLHIYPSVGERAITEENSVTFRLSSLTNIRWKPLVRNAKISWSTTSK